MLRAGFSSAAVLLFLFTFSMIGVGVLSLVTTHHSGSKKTAEKIQSNTLAESGVAVLYDRVRNRMILDDNYPFSVDETPITYVENGDTIRSGVYSARVINVRKVENDIDVGSNKIRRTNFTFTIEGTGIAVNGVASVLRSKFDATVEYNLIKKVTVTHPPNLAEEVCFPIGALVANAAVDIQTNAHFRTTSPNGISGHVMGNDGISWDVQSGDKTTVTDGSVLNIQGQYLVPRGGAYDRTVSGSGIGNTNGSKNYQNPAAPPQGSFLGSPADSVLPLGGNLRFMNGSEVDHWQDRWHTKATDAAGHQFPGDVNAIELTGRTGDGWKIITAPAYIEGDLNIDAASTLRLMPGNTNPQDNIIYVNGNVRNLGKLLNLGVTVVMVGKYEDSAAGEYRVDHAGSPFATRELTLMRSGMYSLNAAADAIQFHTEVNSLTGLVYSMKGGIAIDGADAEFTGTMIAGGVGAQGGIKVRPRNGSGCTMHYEPYAATGGPLESDPDSNTDVTYEVGSIANRFNPGRTYNWRRIK